MSLQKVALLHFVYLLFLPMGTSHFERPTLYVWNVGQGQWVTLTYNEYCLHMDMGGEKAPLERISKLCIAKKNMIFLSHWDWDHLSFLNSYKRKVKSLCRLKKPAGYPQSSYKRKFLKLRECPKSLNFLEEFTPLKSLKLKSNDISRVITLIRYVLLPGDSTQKMEKIWAHKLDLSKTQVLVLGHHGSKTSTSQFLVNRLSRLKMAISSARKKKYGHPHKVVQKRLAQKHVSLLRTEDWNHILIDLSHKLRFKF